MHSNRDSTVLSMSKMHPDQVPRSLPASHQSPCPIQGPFRPAPAYPTHPANAPPQQQCPTPQILPCPTGASDQMIMDQVHAPAVPRSCFRCGQVSHIARNCHLPDTRPNMPRLQVHAANEEEWNADQYENELALL